MSVRKGLLVVAALIGMAAAVPASASPIVVDAGWYEFGFGGVGSTAVDGSGFVPSDPASLFPGDPAWTFDGPASITLQDLFNAGDRFELFDGAISLGISSAPVTPDSCGNVIADCVANLNSSRLTVLVGGGSHSLTIKAVESPFEGGAAVFRVDSAREPVPEPASMFLLGTGLAGLAVKVRRRRQSKA